MFDDLGKVLGFYAVVIGLAGAGVGAFLVWYFG